MSLAKRDPHSGHMTTGHEWNGISELNTRVPRAVWFFLISSFVVSVVMWVLLPAWPIGTTYTRGILGVDERVGLGQSLAAAKTARQDLMTKIDASSYQQARADEEVIGYVRSAGKTMFVDNCAVCHGVNAKGGPGFPDLTDANWLWGNSDEIIMETLQVGINDPHPDTRAAQMPAFGRDETLDAKTILQVIDYLYSLNIVPPKQLATSTNIASGAQLFADNCAVCHGDDARGSVDVGAPNLTDAAWMYGSDRQSVFSSLWSGREGHMPAWETRLTATDRKLLTLYVRDLGAVEKDSP